MIQQNNSHVMYDIVCMYDSLIVQLVCFIYYWVSSAGINSVEISCKFRMFVVDIIKCASVLWLMWQQSAAYFNRSLIVKNFDHLNFHVVGFAVLYVCVICC